MFSRGTRLHYHCVATCVIPLFPKKNSTETQKDFIIIKRNHIHSMWLNGCQISVPSYCTFSEQQFLLNFFLNKTYLLFCFILFFRKKENRREMPHSNARESKALSEQVRDMKYITAIWNLWATASFSFWKAHLYYYPYRWLVWTNFRSLTF